MSTEAFFATIKEDYSPPCEACRDARSPSAKSRRHLAVRRTSRLIPNSSAAALSLRRIAWVVSPSSAPASPPVLSARPGEPGVLLEQRGAPARYAVRARSADRNNAKRGHPVYLLVQAAASCIRPVGGQHNTAIGGSVLSDVAYRLPS